MTKFILMLLFATTAFAKQNFQESQDVLLAKLSTTKEAIQKEGLVWEKGFYQSLIDDEDANVRILGYYHQLSQFNQLKDSDKSIALASELNSILAIDALDKKSISTIAVMCAYEQLRPLCDQQAVFAKQLRMMPDNAYIYLDGFNEAVKSNNQDAMIQALHAMAQSKYFDTFIYTHAAFRGKLEGYVNNNPFPKNKLAMEKLYLCRFAHADCDESNENIDNMQDIQIFSMLIGTKMAQSIPVFRDLINFCKDNLTQEKSCMKLSELLINKSKTIISSQIGYAIKIALLEQSDDEEKLKQAKLEKATSKRHYGCLAKIMNYGSRAFSKNGIEFLKIAEPIEREFGEVAGFESLAQSNYAFYSNLGDENIRNPETCGKDIEIDVKMNHCDL